MTSVFSTQSYVKTKSRTSKRSFVHRSSPRLPRGGRFLTTPWWFLILRTNTRPQPHYSMLARCGRRLMHPFQLTAWAGGHRMASLVSRQQPGSSGINATMLLSQFLLQRSSSAGPPGEHRCQRRGDIPDTEREDGERDWNTSREDGCSNDSCVLIKQASGRKCCEEQVNAVLGSIFIFKKASLGYRLTAKYFPGSLFEGGRRIFPRSKVTQLETKVSSFQQQILTFWKLQPSKFDLFT